MRTRIMLIVSLALLSLPGVLWSMERQPAQSTTRPVAVARPAEQMDVRVYHLQSARAREVVEILRTVTRGNGVTASCDDRTNSIVVSGPPVLMDMVKSLIAALDKASPPTQMMCRAYMVELPPKDQNLKPFSLAIEGPTQLPAAHFLSAVKDAELQIGTFRQSNELAESGHMVFGIQGRAASNEAVRRMLEKIPDALMKELVWENDTFTATVPAAQVTRLPAPLQEHIRKFLGEGVQTVGYWFGNLSLPGEVRAPIGPWMLEVNVESDQNDELRLEVVVTQESQEGGWVVLSNSIRGKVGKPIIIGYNRDRYGMRTMGAMVIVPEVDMTPARSPKLEAK